MGTVTLSLSPHCALLSSCPTVGSELHHHPHLSQATNPTRGTGEGERGWAKQMKKLWISPEFQLSQEASLGAEQSIWFSLSLSALLQFEGLLFAKPEN